MTHPIEVFLFSDFLSCARIIDFSYTNVNYTREYNLITLRLLLSIFIPVNIGPSFPMCLRDQEIEGMEGNISHLATALFQGSRDREIKWSME